MFIRRGNVCGCIVIARRWFSSTRPQKQPSKLSHGTRQLRPTVYATHQPPIHGLGIGYSGFLSLSVTIRSIG
jgi:hypothetical protein